MGQLPAHRVSPSHPFQHTGVDYAGPIWLRTSKGRGQKSYKGYIALFVCMATRAIHLEAVSDLTTVGFIAAFKRFSSRRSLPSCLYSDHGTNFRGADVQLKEMFQATSAEMQELSGILANNALGWKFIPPHAPHFGGIWEAGVRSVKHHLRRVVGDTKLTFEELTTVLAEIEASLNSRPLSPLSNDPEDIVALTPGHFLVGRAIKTLPEPSTLSSPINRLSQWRLLRKMIEDYLHRFQQRSKWTSEQTNVQPGDLVFFVEENLPPGKWHLGRFTEVFPGSDGLVCVCNVRSTNPTILRRPVSNLCRLPVSPDVEDLNSNIAPEP